MRRKSHGNKIPFTLSTPVITYVALGSNEGNRLDFLQRAVDAIFEEIGQITAVSQLYKTPAWGFEGNDFLNACIAVSTRFSAEEVLQKLQQIELLLGRKRYDDDQRYHNRTVDLDILFYGEEQQNSATLTLPHPRIQDRRFVLEPLRDIAAKMIHPTLHKSVAQLANETDDHSEISVATEVLKRPELPFSSLSYLAIEGNIGAGKTSLATMIAQDYNAKLITERFKDNPFLPKFYEDQARYAFQLEMSFLADRYQQLLDDIAQFDLFNDFVVADYDIYKSMIFAGVTLSNEEYNLYKKLFSIMYKDMAKPNLYIYLYQNTDRLLQNIQKRGRSYEQNIPVDYLKNINQGYLEFIKQQNQFNTKIIDVTELDFVANRKDYLQLINSINSALEK